MIAYVHDHQAVVAAAQKAGADVRGYSRRFGIIRVDFVTMARTWKHLGHWYARLISTRQLPPWESSESE